jgi:hypothetical protein
LVLSLFLTTIKIDTTLTFQEGAAKAKEVLGENINWSLEVFFVIVRFAVHLTTESG